MDALYFNTETRDALFQELGITENLNGIYESPDGWVMVWLGKLPKMTVSIKDVNGLDRLMVTEWQDGEFFNIYLKGQKNMDFFTRAVKAAVQILPQPNTPNYTLL